MKKKFTEEQIAFALKQASKRELGYRNFLSEALSAEWKGRHLRGFEARLKVARLP